LIGKPECKIPFGRPKRRWKDNIKMAMKETGREKIDGIHMAQDRDKRLVLVNTIINLRVP
jgi:hypothetical protein